MDAGQKPAMRARPDLKSAYRILEIEADVDLGQARAAYQLLARRYHPRTQETSSAAAATTVIATLTDALEVIEESLLPVDAPL